MKYFSVRSNQQALPRQSYSTVSRLIQASLGGGVDRPDLTGGTPDSSAPVRAHNRITRRYNVCQFSTT